MKHTDQITQKLGDFLAAHPDLQCCYLFGSVTGRDFSCLSDVDVGIAASKPMSASEKQALRGELEVTLDRDVDLVDLHQATGSILRKALQGTCILCRSTRVRYQIMRRLIYDQEDMQPLRNLVMKIRRMRFAYGH